MTLGLGEMMAYVNGHCYGRWIVNGTRRCEARPGGGALDQELAARLNELINQSGSEPMLSLWPAVREIASWVVGATIIAIVSLNWFCKS
ncbi:hypothetical protein PTE30175_00782 [Pandoraea terrae]|uniref:Uncharacterized protein n=1 Tax=Pandoraea terrae TaxID=1537710 RepID=A0A5E4SNN0_9BURK|nr:hypothetical protein [Pandoraea terrae]VVD75489.1 hypothetical protein PTE30175_00782 [Pandoraea terrae]